MELTNSTTVIKTPEPESETPTRIKTSPFTNGLLKRHPPILHHHHHHPIVVTYKECLKNHAATLGGHALDGCGEFMPSPTSNPSSDPASLKCAACGCHRNFHRRDPDDHQQLLLLPPPPNSAPALEFRPHHRHHPPPPPPSISPNNSPSPPPISSAYYPNMLLALNNRTTTTTTTTIHKAASELHGRKRFRTRFTQDQKVKMLELADKLGWKMLKKDEDLIGEVCNEIGVEKGVFKVWMHNNKSTKKEIAISTPPPPAGNGNGNGINYSANDDDDKQNVHPHNVGNNGSSSSC